MGRVLLAVIAFAGLTACSTFDRSSQSGYAGSGDGESMDSVRDFYLTRQKTRAAEARTELGYSTTQELDENAVALVKARIDLARLEKTLEYDAEKKQYYSYKPFFKNDWDRIQFLQLPTREARERWAANRGLKTTETSFDNQTTSLIENNDIGKGMSKSAVQQSWGNADLEEAAGNPVYGNERWIYNKLVSTEEGYKQEKRIIYFEAGRVIGWETN